MSDKQHAFRKWHSCETQLITVINDWANILDKKGQVDTFILDFEKAFDTPPHELLKSNLFSYGIGGKTLEWIMFFVLQAAKDSNWALVVSGVPQGTVLGPLLFSLYINDIHVGIDSQIRLFADDCVCCREIKTVEDILKGTSRQRSGKGAIRKRFPLQKPRREKTKLTIRYLYHETYRKPNEQLFSQ